MSDVERPSGGGSGGGKGGGHSSHGLPARNMADIARLFLEGARPLPARTPPARRAPAPARQDSVPEKAATARSSMAAASPERATTVLGLAGSRREDMNWKLLVQAAQGLSAEMSTAVALVGLLGGGARPTFVVDVVGVESVEELPVVQSVQESGGGGAGSGGSIDMQIARALHRLAPAVGLWIIAAPAAEARTFPAIASIVREWLLACPTDNDGLIAGYQYLKQAWGRAGAGEAGARELKIVPTVYLLAEDYAQAVVVHKRLRKAAQEFLGTDLALAGAGPIHRGGGGNNASAPEPIRILSVACQGPEDAVWAAVLDELCPMADGEESFPPTEIETALDHVATQAADVARHSSATAAAALDHLAQVLDPEERAALAADFPEPGVPVATARRGSGEEEADSLSTAAAAIPPMPPIFRDSAVRAAPAMEVGEPAAANEPVATPVAHVPVLPQAGDGESKHATSGNEPGMLRAFDMDARLDRAAQWQAVERSIWDLSPRAALLDARPPMSWASETCLSIDAGGRVNVWTLYKDGASWFALREWAHEHRNLLALTRRDLVVDKEAEVAVHIVLPLEGEEAGRPEGVATMLLRTPGRNVHLYRLRGVAWNQRRGVVVVPLA